MRMKVLAVVGALAMGGTVLVAAAQERPARQGRQGRPGAPALAAELGLSAEQSADLARLRSEARKQAIRNRSDLAIARIELEELMDAPTVDEKAVDAKVKAISDLQAAALKARVDERLAMRGLLTPEQQEKMKQLRHQGRGPRAPHSARGWRDGGPGPGQPPPSPEPER